MPKKSKNEDTEGLKSRGVRLYDRQWVALTKLAATVDRDNSYLIRAAIEEYLERQAK